MIKRANEMSVTHKQMRDGLGVCEIVEFLPKEEMDHCRLFGTITIPPGCSIGEHPHIDECEYYWIMEGEGILSEKEEESVVTKGDLVITKDGATHAIRNEKERPLKLLALIILE